MKRLIPRSLRIEFRRARRSLMDLLARQRFAGLRVTDSSHFPFELIRHSSPLIRKVDPKWITLQENKVHNLRLACARLDGLAIQPSEVFSFCHTVGRTTRRKGYRDGLEMHEGVLVGAPGGGLCQMSNLLYWMVLHLDLQILERHRHESDLFADDDRIVPFGMGATVFYNYRDLRFRNTLPQPLVLRVSVNPPLLCGSIVSSAPISFAVEVYQTDERFRRRADGRVWRENRVAKRVSYNDEHKPAEVEIAHNIGLVCYEVPEERIEKGPAGTAESQPRAGSRKAPVEGVP